MRASRAALGLWIIAAITGCYPMQVRTDFDPQVPFAQLRSYNWIDRESVTGGGPAIDSPLLERRVRNAVDSVLANRGYREVSSDADPDFRVTFSVVAEEIVVVDGYGGYYPYAGSYGRHGFGHHGFGYSPYFYDPYYGGGYTRTYVQSTLVLDIVDAETGDLVWRGWADKQLDGNPKPDEVRNYVHEAVEKILREFPPTTQRKDALVAPV